MLARCAAGGGIRRRLVPPEARASSAIPSICLSARAHGCAYALARPCQLVLRRSLRSPSLPGWVGWVGFRAPPAPGGVRSSSCVELQAVHGCLSSGCGSRALKWHFFCLQCLARPRRTCASSAGCDSSQLLACASANYGALSTHSPAHPRAACAPHECAVVRVPFAIPGAASARNRRAHALSCAPPVRAAVRV